MQHPARTAAESIPRLRKGQFQRATPQDLRKLYEIYDREDFGGALQASLGGLPLRFRWSTRMTRTAGKTTVIRSPRGPVRYEIAISSLLLTQTFAGEAREITVCGVACGDRLDALLRVFEHELVHLFELLEFGDSNCRARRFMRLVSRFGHTEATHRLVTPRERAATQHGVTTGARVRFMYDGRALEGVVNRVTKRATILVDDPAGQRYSDGRTYAKYYVPLELLAPVG